MIGARATPVVEFQPSPSTWRPGTEPPTLHHLSSWRSETREMLGHAPDDVIVATGHQAQIWHPGILAKDLAVTAAIARFREHAITASPLHFIADHDANDGGLLAYPTRALTRGGWRMLPSPEGRSLRDQPPSRPTDPPTDAHDLPGVTEGLRAIHSAVAEQAGAESLSWQLGLAAADLARPFTGEIPRRSMSRLLETPVGTGLLEAIARDPDACITAHDAAIEADRQARASGSGRLPRGVARPLRRGAIEELPLWRSTPTGRRPVLRGEPVDPADCRPRALLATALARLGGCDLFVHGLGGGRYDRAMETWIEGWLGSSTAAALAPATVATATLRLPIPEGHSERGGPHPTPEGLHRLQSDPDLGRQGPPRRASLLAAIENAPRRSQTRRAAFDAFRAEILAARSRGRDEIDRYRTRLDEDTDRRRAREVATDRAWAFPLHEASALSALTEAVRISFIPA